MSEIFDIVDDEDRVIGSAARSEVHGNPELKHRVVHVLVFNSEGELFLQKRADDKDVQPGKWDTSVGGHLDRSETYLAAALRETSEELGISTVEESSFSFMYKYLHSNSYETEFVTTYRLIYDGEINLQLSEISDGRFWTFEEIENSDKGLFTPNFLDEIERYSKKTPEGKI